MSYLTLPEIAELVKTKRGERSQRALARELGVSDTFLSDVIKGRRKPGPTLLKALGYDPTPHFAKRKGGKP
jgi:predicted transcriptional regulator